jgi:hypothetical protein
MKCYVLLQYLVEYLDLDVTKDYSAFVFKAKSSTGGLATSYHPIRRAY